MSDLTLDELRLKLEALAHEWQNRIILGRYCSREDQLQANVYDNCSDELLELIHNTNH